MPKIVDITNEVVGDTIIIPVQITGLPSGTTITKVYFTVKSDELGIIDGSALIQKMITSGFTHTGTTSITCSFNITLTNVDTMLFTAKQTYFYDIQSHRSDGVIRTPIKGSITLEPGITEAVM